MWEMFRDTSVEGEGDWTLGASEAAPDHGEIDRQLRRLAKQRAGLDAEEARWLRRADEANSWRAFGYVHALEYLEDVFGYAPRTAQERLRVARELGGLPVLEAELESGGMPYSVVRELTRVATAETEGRWLERARGRNFRQVEQMVAGHKKGDEPTDEIDPSLVDHTVTWKLDAATRALLRETRIELESELGHALDDATFVETLCRRATEDVDVKATATRPRTTIHMTTCRRCKTSVQHAAGAPVTLTDEQVERVECDAQIVDDEGRKRAASKIPPAMRRRVFERDQYRCRFPGCRSTRNLEIHHLRHRAHGGDHRSGNLGVLCGGHHKLNHDGVIAIGGDADGELIFTRNGVEIRGEDDRALGGPARTAGVKRVGASRYRDVERNALAKSAMKQAGYTHATATRAVETALARVPQDAPLDVLLREAFRHCG